MRRITATLVGVVLLLALMVTGAPAKPEVASYQAKGQSKLEKQYQKLYWSVVRSHGRRSPGRNIVYRGIKTHGRVRPASKKELATSIRTFKRWLAPPVASVARTDRVPSGQTPAYAGGKWAIPSYIVMCESGGNYNARNPSGAYGAYQIMPGTAAAYGCNLSTPGGQDACAAKIYARQGSAPWSCG